MIKTSSLSVLFAGTLFLSAMLMFMIEPMFTKMVLPLLGGAPAVWNTALMFFQVMLLVGYLYAHLTTRFLRPTAQLLLHLCLLILAFGFLPISVAQGWEPPARDMPIPWLVALLTVSIGMPFFIVSATAPLLQRWFAYTSHQNSSDPYFLYSASNLGALLALLCYPVVIEPLLGLYEQSVTWSVGYLVLALAIGLCGYSWWKYRHDSGDKKAIHYSASKATQNSPATSLFHSDYWLERFQWVSLAFVPSALLLAVTLYISIDIASAPFLWVIPLALFLLSFVIVFARKPILKHQWMLQTQTWVYIALALYFTAPDLWLLFGLHLLALFVTAMVCHGELAKRRPKADRLTEFYLWMSVGGLLGGVFGALIAPTIFDTVLEYPLLIILACLLRPPPISGEPRDRLYDLILPLLLALFYFSPRIFPALNPTAIGTFGPLFFYGIIAIALYHFRARPLRFALGITILIFGWDILGSNSFTLAQERSFFGVYEVQKSASGRARLLTHGTTIHGAEATNPAYARLPLTYYNQEGPLGQLIAALNREGRITRIGVVGLGTGTIACYVQPGQTLTFYEIDPVIERIARNPAYFRYLQLCGNSVNIVIGDGRQNLAKAPDGEYDLLVLDAFSSDAVPVHLITREALRLYLKKLSNNGLALFNVSNRYVHLEPVFANLAAEMGLHARIQSYVPNSRELSRGGFESDWIVIARNATDLNFTDGDSRWQRLSAQPGKGVWTDDYSNIFGTLTWQRLLWRR